MVVCNLFALLGYFQYQKLTLEPSRGAWQFARSKGVFARSKCLFARSKGVFARSKPRSARSKGVFARSKSRSARSKPLFARSKSRFTRSEFWPLRRKTEMRACLSAHTPSIGQKMSEIASETTHTADVPPHSPMAPHLGAPNSQNTKFRTVTTVLHARS